MPKTPSSTAAPGERANLVLAAVLRALRPLVRLLLRQGVQHRNFSIALKQVFLDAAREELRERGMPETDSAITLLSGVHRRDVRTLRDAAASGGLARPAGVASEVVGRWLAERRHRHRDGRLRVLPRGVAAGSFDTLVHGVSRDIRPRALLDELVRLGVAEERPEGVALLAESFTPRRGLDAMAALFADNLHDHAAAAAENLHHGPGGPNHLEQAIFVDELTEASVARLRQASVKAWKLAYQQVMGEAKARFDDDAAHAPAAERTQRARFGVYFYRAAMQPPSNEEASA